MNRNDLYVKQLFAPDETGTTVTTDVEPAISIDITTRFAQSIKVLREALGITRMIPMAEGSVIKLYKATVGTVAQQVGEGEKIGLTKVTRALAGTYTMTWHKYRRRTTAESIQKSGRAVAINELDSKLVGTARATIKSAFFANLASGIGTATPIANGLQAALAAVWGQIQDYYEDYDVTPVFFVNPLDVADYLATASITTQTAFGFSYIENFLGLGRAFLSKGVTQGTVIGTATENLNGAYIPASGDVAQTFGLTYDETGLIGIKHALADSELSVDTVILDGVVFYAEDLSGVFKASIATAAAENTGSNAGGENAGGTTTG